MEAGQAWGAAAANAALRKLVTATRPSLRAILSYLLTFSLFRCETRRRRFVSLCIACNTLFDVSSAPWSALIFRPKKNLTV